MKKNSSGYLDVLKLIHMIVKQKWSLRGSLTQPKFTGAKVKKEKTDMNVCNVFAAPSARLTSKANTPGLL